MLIPTSCSCTEWDKNIPLTEKHKAVSCSVTRLITLAPRVLQYNKTYLLTNQGRFWTTNHHQYVCLRYFPPLFQIHFYSYRPKMLFEDKHYCRNEIISYLFGSLTLHVHFFGNRKKPEILPYFNPCCVCMVCKCVLFIAEAYFVRLHPQRPPIIMEFRKQI